MVLSLRKCRSRLHVDPGFDPHGVLTLRLAVCRHVNRKFCFIVLKTMRRALRVGRFFGLRSGSSGSGEALAI
jgi:hypothetical protein